MKFTGYVDIERPREVVVSYFIDPKYLDGFIKKELISGQVGEPGAVSILYYGDDKRKMELTETVITNDLPNIFIAEYHHKHMDNSMKCEFHALDEDRTRYKFEFEYTRINWIIPKLIAILFPSVYRKQGEKWMRQFKEFVEKQ